MLTDVPSVVILDVGSTVSSPGAVMSVSFTVRTAGSAMIPSGTAFSTFIVMTSSKEYLLPPETHDIVKL